MKKAFEAIGNCIASTVKTLKSAYSIMVLRFKTRDGFRKSVEELIKEAYELFTVVSDEIGELEAYYMIREEYGYTTMKYVLEEYNEREYFKKEK